MPTLKQELIHGIKDDVVPVEMSRSYRDVKGKRGEDVELIEIADAGHFDLIDPQSMAWRLVEKTILKMLG